MRKKLLTVCLVLLGSKGFAQFPAPYCAEGYDYVKPITYVDFAGITNTSPAIDGGTNQHEDYTAMMANVSQGTTYTITIKGNTVDPWMDYISVFIDWNQDGTFAAGEIYHVGTISNSDGTDAVTLVGNITVPIGAATGSTRMRVSKLHGGWPDPCNTFGDGQAEDYTVIVAATGPCSGTPTAGTVSGPGYACDTTSFTLNLSGYTAATGITYQWQSSTDGISFANIPGETDSSLTTTQPDSMYYQVIVTCSVSGMSATSPVLFVDMIQCACHAGYSTGTIEGDYVGMVQVGSINNITVGAPDPFYTLYSTPTTSLSKLTSYTLTLSAGTYTQNDLAAWIDYNQDGVFDVSEKLGETNDLPEYPAMDAYTFVVPSSALTGTTILRVREDYSGAPGIDPCFDDSYGETEDYVITILPAPPCVNAPVSGTISGPASDSVGMASQFVITGENGDNIQWYESTDGGLTWSPIASATNDTLMYTPTSLSGFSLYVVMSSAGCTSDTTSIFNGTVISNDNACNAFTLAMGINGPYSTVGASVEPGEIYPMGGDCQSQSSWCNNTLDGTLWFTFIAPASGRVSINSPGYDTQLALWKADDCTQLYDTSVVEFIAANDDDTAYLTHGTVQYSSFIQGLQCLTPGKRYYLQLDSYFSPDTTSIILTDLGPSPTAPVVTINDQDFCGSVMLDAGNPGMAYNWSNGDTTQTTTFTTTDTVWVAVLDSLNCPGVDSAIITNITPVSSFTATNVSGGTFNFTNTGNPMGGYAGATYAWDFGDSGTSTLENPSHTYATGGTYNVTFTITDACGNVVSLQPLTVSIAGLNEAGNISGIQVFPNPAFDHFNIAANENINQVCLVNASGQRVLNNANVNTTKTELNIEGIARGMYFIEVVTNRGTFRQQVSILK